MQETKEKDGRARFVCSPFMLVFAAREQRPSYLPVEKRNALSCCRRSYICLYTNCFVQALFVLLAWLRRCCACLCCCCCNKQRAREQTRFVVLTTPRTGSTMLVNVLNAHSQIHCKGEILVRM
jgi:hypothetical protein